MNDRADRRQDLTPAGLCAACRHGRVIESDRQSRYWLCERSRTDPAYPRFPALPVHQCRGHQPPDEAAGG